MLCFPSENIRHYVFGGGERNFAVEDMCREAGLLCIKEAIERGEDHERVVVRMDHLESAIEQERSRRQMFQLKGMVGEGTSMLVQPGLA